MLESERINCAFIRKGTTKLCIIINNMGKDCASFIEKGTSKLCIINLLLGRGATKLCMIISV